MNVCCRVEVEEEACNRYSGVFDMCNDQNPSWDWTVGHVRDTCMIQLGEKAMTVWPATEITINPKYTKDIVLYTSVRKERIAELLSNRQVCDSRIHGRRRGKSKAVRGTIRDVCCRLQLPFGVQGGEGQSG